MWLQVHITGSLDPSVQGNLEVPIIFVRAHLAQVEDTLAVSKSTAP